MLCLLGVVFVCLLGLLLLVYSCCLLYTHAFLPTPRQTCTACTACTACACRYKEEIEEQKGEGCHVWGELQINKVRTRREEGGMGESLVVVEFALLGCDWEH